MLVVPWSYTSCMLTLLLSTHVLYVGLKYTGELGLLDS